MQYNIYINQIKALEWGLKEREALIIDTILRLPTWAKGKEIDGEIYYYLSAGLLIKELPWISSSKGSFLNIIKSLKDKNLLEHILIGNQSYYKLTPKIKEWVSGLTDGGDKVSLNSDAGLTDGGDYNNTNNNINNYNNNVAKEINNVAKEIFDYYISKTEIPNQYRYPSATKLYLEALLKEYNKETLILSIDNYFKVTEIKYRKSPKYFFSNSKRSDNYRMFEGFLNKEIDKPKIRTNLIDDFIP